MWGNWEREWEGMGMSVWENNGNGNKCLADVGMRLGLKLIWEWNEWESWKPFPHTSSPDMKRLGHDTIELNDVT